jgi:threonine aldolase
LHVTQPTTDVVDLRTDAVAQPTDVIWAAMHEAEVGWAMAREDPSINELQELRKALVGLPSAGPIMQ